MAYIETRKNAHGQRFILRYVQNGAAHKIFLPPDLPFDDARLVCAIITRLLSRAPSCFTTTHFNALLDVLPDVVKGKFCGSSVVSLRGTWDEYTNAVRGSVAKATADHDAFAFRRFVNLCPVASFGELTREVLTTVYAKMTAQFSRSTASHTVGTLRTFGNWAVNAGKIAENPFLHMPKHRYQRSITREHYVDLETSESVLKVCPSPQWRALFCLWRFAGLRAKEPIFLTRSSVDLRLRRLKVYSQKTARYPGKDYRFVPLDERVAGALTELLESTNNDRLISLSPSYLDSGLKGILERAKIPRWPKIHQNLRASCENDWIARGVPAHVVATWLGHSLGTQTNYYLSITPASWRLVTGETGACAGLSNGS